MADTVRTLQEWIEIPSVTGEESDYGDCVARFAEGLGLSVERQAVAPGRFNVLARSGTPELVFCTHLDTVPPYWGPRYEAGVVHGRGACDAKGPALAMLSAAAELLREGEERIGFLFTVGEETDSAGAALANARLAEPWKPAFTVIGEPTDNEFVRAHKGAFKARLCARGVAGHSSQDIGPSAVHELIACLDRLLNERWGDHPVLGPGTLNIGVVHGGVASNVVADRALADLLLRAVEEPAEVEERIRAALGPHVELEQTFKNYGPIEFYVPDGHAGKTVAFGTDAPHLPRWGTPLLYGPGRILDAHTDHECLSMQSFDRAVGDYIAVARELLAQLGVRP